MQENQLHKENPPKGLELTRAKRLQVLTAVAIGTFMAPLDSSVVNIALPSISAYFKAPLATVEWVVMSYLLIISSLLLTYGRLGDMYGHKRIYICGMISFTLGSLLCAISPTIMALIIFRALQALGAGMMMAMGPAIVTDITPPHNRGKALGIIAVSVSIALTVGPILGGVLTTYFGWPSIFLINLPIGIFAVVLALKSIPHSEKREINTKFDIPGAIILITALLIILTSLSYTEKVGWSNPYLLIALAIGLVLLGVFVFIEKKVKYPMVDLSLFKNKLFSMGNLSSLLNYMSMFSVTLIMPFYLQQLRNLPPSKAGFMLIPMPLMTMVIAPISGTISDKIDTRYVSSLGMAISGISMLLLSTLKENTSTIAIIFYLALMGLGSGIFQTPNNSAVMGSAPPHRRGIASSLLATMRNMGMVLGVAISGAVFTSYMNHLNSSLTKQGITGNLLKTLSFTGALHATYLVGATFAFIAVITSLVRGPLQEKAKG